MTPVLHYTMGGLEIDDHSRVIDESGKPIVSERVQLVEEIII